jgi:hypothetical protein
MADPETTPDPVPAGAYIPEWLVDNYRQLVAERGDSFTALANRSDGALAAWARAEAAAAGENITPAAATPAPAPAVRTADQTGATGS